MNPRSSLFRPLVGFAVLATPAAIYYGVIANKRSYNPAFFEARTAILHHCIRQPWPYQQHRCVEFIELMDSCDRREFVPSRCDPEETFKFLVTRDFPIPDLYLPAAASKPQAQSGAFDDLIPTHSR